MNATAYSFVAGSPDLVSRLQSCRAARLQDASLQNLQAVRLFNGYHEGHPGLLIDRYCGLLLISNHNPESIADTPLVDQIYEFYTQNQVGISGYLLKERRSPDSAARRGLARFPGELPGEISENGVNYALDLRLNQDDSFYLDTRSLRAWLKDNLGGKSVLNCFAYTGALGVAALAGGACHVTQTDLNANWLNLAEKSAALNGVQDKQTLLAGDFFRIVGRLKAQQALFDCVIIDPPLFSRSRAGEVDLLGRWTSLVNKARPLIGHEGWLVAVNNALYLPGEELLQEWTRMTKPGYLEIALVADITADITGYQSTVVNAPPTDPKPYNHPTKITILRAYRKDGRRATD